MQLSKKMNSMNFFRVVVAGFWMIGGGVAWAAGQPGAAPFSTVSERCIVPASEYHGVNPYVLRAILRVESGLRPGAIGKNNNGTVDVGIGQMNSMHFKELAKHGVPSDYLMDACVGTYVAAWHLKKSVGTHGNNWNAIARYHSATPYFNRRYQILLNNELVRSQVIAGVIYPVPSINPPSR